MIIFILDIKFSLSLSDSYFDYCYLNHGVFSNKTNHLKKISIHINTLYLHIHIQVMLFFQDLIVYDNHYPNLLGYNFSSSHLGACILVSSKINCLSNSPKIDTVYYKHRLSWLPDLKLATLVLK